MVVAVICLIIGVMFGTLIGSDPRVSDVTIGKVLEILGDQYDNSTSFKLDDYEELYKRINALRKDTSSEQDV